MTKKPATAGRKYHRRKGLGNIKGQKHVTNYLKVEVCAYRSSRKGLQEFVTRGDLISDLFRYFKNGRKKV